MGRNRRPAQLALANQQETDRSIYAALHAGDIPATGPLI
jgi:hypothetical protein